MMRTLVVLLLFQFISPSLFPVVTLGSVSDDGRVALTTSHSSIVVPILLKEQEERDHEDNFIKSLDFTTVVDFFNHSRSHTASQSIIYKGHKKQDRFTSEPPLFKRYCNFLI